MIVTVHLKNFRCFADHHIEFGPLSVLVGQNNAGKTTAAEALRLIAMVAERYRSLAYGPPPAWLNLPARCIGCSPSLQGMEMDFSTLFNQYGPPPAIVTAEFANSTRVEIYLGPDSRIHSLVKDAGGHIVRSKAQALRVEVPRVAIMPQVAPLSRSERILDPDYVRSAISSHLSPLHFRNQLHASRSLFREFKALVEATWPQLQVLDLIRHGSIGERSLSLNIRDRGFVAEVGAMGHGLQMWMQAMWFLIRASGAKTAILDEPDVYMHPDLQRKLMRVLRTRFPQSIVTTHSTEIVSEVEPSEIIVIDRSRPSSTRLDSLPSVQRVVESIGSIHNLQLTRLWSSKRFILVEGDDLRLLRYFHETVYPNTELPLDTIPNMPIGGWGGWSYAVGTALFLQNAAGDDVRVFCVLDHDYHVPEQITPRQHEAVNRRVQLHIWNRKEIENYLLVPSAIARCIRSAAANVAQPVDAAAVQAQLERIARSLKETAFDGYAQECLAVNRALGVAGANKRAREIIEARSQEVGLLSIVSGKKVLSKISGWSQAKYGASLSASLLARTLLPSEIDEEVTGLLRQIHT